MVINPLDSRRKRIPKRQIGEQVIDIQQIEFQSPRFCAGKRAEPTAAQLSLVMFCIQFLHFQLAGFGAEGKFAPQVLERPGKTAHHDFSTTHRNAGDFDIAGLTRNPCDSRFDVE